MRFRFSFGVFFLNSLLGLRRILPRTDPVINDILIESPNTANLDTGNLTFSGILTNGDLMEFQVSGYFFGCHDVGHRSNPPEKKVNL